MSSNSADAILRITDLGNYAILLDVDGTILDLAPTPREVWVPPGLRHTLSKLWKLTGGAVALVSGRLVDELDLLFTPLELPTVGGHGAEFRPFAGGDTDRARTPPLDKNLKRQLAAVAEIGRGVIVEDKGYSLALHYRLAPEKEHRVRDAVDTICAKQHSVSIEILPGKFMVEIKQVGFNKATAVRELMTYRPFHGRRPIFIGDDTTDESVFAILPELNGIAMSVGPPVPGVRIHFDAPVDVRRWLATLVRDKEAIARTAAADPRPV